MKKIILILLMFPLLSLGSEQYIDNFDKVEKHITCNPEKAYSIATSSAEARVFESAENYDKDSMNILAWKKNKSSIIFKASFKHNRVIEMYCEDNVEITLSKDCELLDIDYVGH